MIEVREFKQIPNHPNYGVNGFGEVMNIKTGRYLKPEIVKGGLLRVEIGGYKYYIHKLVAEAFLGDSRGKRFVIHKDGNNSNNIYTNLMWSSDYGPRC